MPKISATLASISRRLRRGTAVEGAWSLADAGPAGGSTMGPVPGMGSGSEMEPLHALKVRSRKPTEKEAAFRREKTKGVRAVTGT